MAAWTFSDGSISDVRPQRPHPPGDHRRNPRKITPRPTPSAICSRAVGFRTTSRSGSDITKTTPLGICCTIRGSFSRNGSQRNRRSRGFWQRRRNELDIAEGSDWFWWFGDDHSSAQDAVFDELFRRHLINVYRLLGSNPPNALNRPITRADHRLLHTQPTGFLPVKVTGRATYFEWISAGKYISGSERGTMTLVTEGFIKRRYFGFDKTHLFLRADTAQTSARDDFQAMDELRVRFQEPASNRDSHSRVGHRKPRRRAVSASERSIGEGGSRPR